MALETVGSGTTADESFVVRVLTRDGAVPRGATGALLVTLVPLPDGGYATLLPDGGYKLEGDPTDRLWWAIKLCRFEAGELDPYVPGIRRLPLHAPVLPPRELG